MNETTLYAHIPKYSGKSTAGLKKVSMLQPQLIKGCDTCLVVAIETFWPTD